MKPGHSGRRFADEPTKAWKINLPATLAGRVEHRLMDPVTGKPRYGDRGKLIETLLEEWLSKQEATV